MNDTNTPNTSFANFPAPFRAATIIGSAGARGRKLPYVISIYRYRVLILITRDSSRGGRSVVIGVWSRQSHSTARFSGPTVHVRGRAATLSMTRTRVVVRSVLIPLLLLSVVGVGRRVDAKRTKRKSVAAAVLTAPPLPPTWLAELTVVGWTEATTAHQGGDLSTAATRYQSLLYFPGR